MSKKPVRKLLATCIAGALFLPGIAYTLGLGEIEVNSALNQQLDADIELLSAVPEDAESLIVKLASREAFSRAGLDRPYQLNDLRFRTVVIDDVPHIKITSRSPVREPFLNFLLEVDWPKGHMLREYTILLDPPSFMTQSRQAPLAATDKVASRPTSNNVRPAANDRPAATVASRPAPAVATDATPAPRRAGGDYRIQDGDTAWSLANRMRPDASVSVEQMMVALLRANPESFIDENVNGLKRGYILRMPEEADIRGISPAEARAMVREHAALWRQYRQTSTLAAMPREADDTAATVPAATDDPLATGQGDARLKIVSAGEGAATGIEKDPTEMTAAELREALAYARERLESERVEKEMLYEEIQQLEQQLNTDRSGLAVESAGLAGVQSLAADGQPTGEDVTGSQETMSGDLADSGSQDAETPAVFVDEANTGQAVNGDTDEAQSAATAPPVRPVTPPAVPVQPQPVDPLSRLLADPMLMAAAGSGLLLVLALVYLVIRRRKAAAAETESTPAVADSAGSASTSIESVADMVEQDQQDDLEAVADEVEQADRLDTESTMILEAVDTGVSDDTVVSGGYDDIVEDDEEVGDDVIAEADVYLAYGIYQQAEELLTGAIANAPDRDDYRLKLAETHFASKNEAGFTEVAAALKERTGGDGKMWQKVVAMGQELCPGHELFSDTDVDVEGVDVEALAPKSPEMDFDLSLDEQAQDDVPDLDLSFDDFDADAAPPADDAAADDMTETAILDIDDALGAEAAEVGDEAGDEDVVDLSADLDGISDDDLNFDLDDAQDDTADETASAEADDDEEFMLDIDASELDIDADAVAAAADEAAAETVDEQNDDQGDDQNDEVDLEATMQVDSTDFDPGEQDAAGSEAAADEAAVDELAADVGDIDIDFGLDETGEAAGEDVSEEAPEDEATVVLDADELADELAGEMGEEMDISLDATDSDDAASADTPDTGDIDLDFGDADLDDDPSSSEDTTATVTEASDTPEPVAADEEDAFDLSSLDDVDEISTKLDLARAYLDMGDDEGTREILKEVLADGNDSQKQEATELMEKLAS